MAEQTNEQEAWMETADEQMAKILPESPASANLRVYINGFSAQITIRGISHKALITDIEDLVTMAQLKGWAPSWSPSTNKELGYANNAPTQQPVSQPASSTKLCEMHNIQMEQKYSQPKQKFYFVHYNGSKQPCFGKGYL